MLPRPDAEDAPNFKLPPTTAIAGVLTRAWATDGVAGWSITEDSLQKTVEPRL